MTLVRLGVQKTNQGKKRLKKGPKEGVRAENPKTIHREPVRNDEGGGKGRFVP